MTNWVQSPYQNREAAGARGFRRIRMLAAASALLLAGSGISLRAQSQAGAAAVRIYPWQVNGELREQLKTLGDRLQKPGRERVAISGVLADSAGDSAVQLLAENGNKLRVDWTSGQRKTVIFDGAMSSASAGQLSGQEQDLLESLVDDTVEALMLATSKGAGFRLLGRRFASSAGGACDLYDVHVRAATRGPSQVRVKRYCFDSRTALLVYVRYQGGDSAKPGITETRFSDWRKVDGQAFPGRIVRTQGGAPVFTFQAHQASFTPTSADNAFAGVDIRN